MSLPRAFHRPWGYLTAIALVACGLGVVGALQGIGVLPVTSTLERRGEFVVGYDTYDAFGYRGTRRTLYYQGKGKLPAGNGMWAPPDQQGPAGTIYYKRASELPNGMLVQVP
jgi:hypothetical protein